MTRNQSMVRPETKRGSGGAKRAARKALFNAILKLGSAEECEKFFVDLCTPGELDSISDRWEVARLLEKKVSYRDIYELTGVSTATITRVARALMHGEGGYRLALDNSKETKGV